MPHINWLAVLAAAVSTFVLGGLWYSKALFGRAWMSVNNLSEADLAKSNMIKIFGLSLIFAVIMAATWPPSRPGPKTPLSGAQPLAFWLVLGGWRWPSLPSLCLSGVPGNTS